MAAPNTITGTNVLVKIETTAGSGTFLHPCLINSDRGIVFQSDNNQEVVPDCDNPDDPGWKLLTKDGFSATISGSGKLDTASVAAFDAWFRSDDSKVVRLYLGEHGYWSLSAKLTEWSVNGSRGQRAECSVTIISDGTVGAYTAL